MGSVVNLSDYQPRVIGKAHCVGCLHDWEAVVPYPLQTMWLECPKCKTMMGRFFHHFERSGLRHWHCGCGSDLFFIVEGGRAYCPNCALWHEGF